MPVRKVSAYEPLEIAHRYRNIVTALPTAPIRYTGRRPIRSDSVAHSGIAASATTLASAPTHSMAVRDMPTESLVA